MGWPASLLAAKIGRTRRGRAPDQRLAKNRRANEKEGKAALSSPKEEIRQNATPEELGKIPKL